VVNLARASNKMRTLQNRLPALASMTFGWSLSKPAYVCAKMTARCNSRCRHCDVWRQDDLGRELSTGEWFRVLSELAAWLGPFPMVFTGGEALLRGDLIAILQQAVRLGIRVELLTNALLIDQELAQSIVSTGIERITVSLDGFSPEVHDRFRGGDGFHARTTAALQALIRWRRRLAAPLSILLKTVISADNVRELAALARFAAHNGLQIRYQPIEQNYGQPPDPGWYRDSPLWVRELAPLGEELAELKSLQQKEGAVVNDPADFDRYLRYFREPEPLMATIQGHDCRKRFRSCPHAVDNFVISEQGEVRMCFQMEPIGNVASGRPDRLWEDRQRCWAGPCEFR